MGNRHSSYRNRILRDEASVFDIMGMLVDFEWHFPPILPSCLDELVDWSLEATLLLELVNESHSNDPLSADSHIHFVPIISKSILRREESGVGGTKLKPGEDIEKAPGFATQNDVLLFPRSAGFVDLVKFYSEDVLVLVLAPDYPSYIALSVVHFAEYVKLCRRLHELIHLESTSQLVEYSGEGNNPPSGTECAICMGRAEQTVLPCMHELCVECEGRWVDTHSDCPFCRKQFACRQKRKREQWQLESWSGEEVQRDIDALSTQLSSVLKAKSMHVAQDIVSENYTRLQGSIEGRMVDDNFFLLT